MSGTTATILLLALEWSQRRDGRWERRNQGCTWHFGLLNQSTLQTALILDFLFWERMSFLIISISLLWEFKYSNWQRGGIHFIGLQWKLNETLWSAWKVGSTRWQRLLPFNCSITSILPHLPRQLSFAVKFHLVWFPLGKYHLNTACYFIL